ncbi:MULTISPECIES: hypothetical protein [Cytobacillus]|uniref:hypothetical protein n=1 Tax=Cytobacillus TaxID=2675230 RepID=UPI00135BAA23|nr:hypothetical protein [Cytobacillus firmus]KAF0818987.1 hypothetical protein KIS4809_2279 [Bacillus sp. ZZV12-4809]MCM3704292.1 hypothetical protein [Cytobacillus firmus]
MLTLTEEQYVFIKEYSDLLFTIDEAFDYIVKSFSDFSKTEGERLLGDIFQAFPQVASAHEQLSQFVQGNESFLKTIADISAVADHAEQFIQNFDDLPVRQEIISKKLYPAFAEWHENIQQELNPYIQS